MKVPVIIATLLVVSTHAEAQSRPDRSSWKWLMGNAAIRGDLTPKRWQISAGVSYDYTYFPNFERIAGEAPGVLESSGGKSTSGIGVFGDIGLSNEWPISLSLALARGTHHIEQEYQAGAGSPGNATGEITGTFFDVMFRWHRPYRGFGWFFGGGAAYANNDAEFTYANGGGITQKRNHTAVLPRATVGLNYLLDNNLGLRFQLDQAGFRSNDADTHTRSRFGIYYNF